MTLEFLNTFASFGTFAVIAATAIAALVQLRHARSSNQIAAMNELQEVYQKQ
jgi:23S rRNA G2069 N7-methylase RlmK/C1962 C5-methylase RlmI